MKTIQGPALFIAQFIGDEPPFHSLDSIAAWAADLGFKGLQLPSNDARFLNLQQAAESKSYCEDLLATLDKHDLALTEISTHLQGQLVAVHPAFDKLFASFGPAALRDRPSERQAWATEQMILAAKASRNLGLSAHATFSGALAWPYFYPWPQRPQGLIEEAFAELAKRWLPILNAFDEAGVDACFELHPGEDLHDGATFERFLEEVNHHSRAKILFDPSHYILQQLDYLAFLDLYYPLIRAFHVKDAEYRPNGRSGVYGGYQPWIDRPGRFRSLGDGQVDFKAVFSKLAQYDYLGWAVLEWEDCIKNGEDGAREGAAFIESHMIHVTGRAFDDFAAAGGDPALNRSLLGIG